MEKQKYTTGEGELKDNRRKFSKKVEELHCIGEATNNVSALKACIEHMNSAIAVAHGLASIDDGHSQFEKMMLQDLALPNGLNAQRTEAFWLLARPKYADNTAPCLPSKLANWASATATFNRYLVMMAMNLHYCNGYEVVVIYAKPHKNGALGMSTFATPGARPFLGTGPFNGRPEGGRLCCQLFERFMKDKKDQASQPSIEVHQELEEPGSETNLQFSKKMKKLLKFTKKINNPLKFIEKMMNLLKFTMKMKKLFTKKMKNRLKFTKKMTDLLNFAKEIKNLLKLTKKGKKLARNV
eukprot:gene6463-7195_t